MRQTCGKSVFREARPSTGRESLYVIFSSKCMTLSCRMRPMVERVWGQGAPHRLRGRNGYVIRGPVANVPVVDFFGNNGGTELMVYVVERTKTRRIWFEVASQSGVRECDIRKRAILQPTQIIGGSFK